MSHISIQLHENFVHEHIGDAEYAIIREEFAAIGFTQTAVTNGCEHRLPRSCYFGTGGTPAAVSLKWRSIERRLGRRASVEFTEGSSYGFGLKSAHQLMPLLSLRSAAQATSAPSLLDLLSNPEPKRTAGEVLLRGLTAKI